MDVPVAGQAAYRSSGWSGNDLEEEEQVRVSGENLAGALGTAYPSWPRNIGPSWPSSIPTALAEGVVGMCRRTPDVDHPFAYWVMAPWGAEGRDEQEPLQAVHIESARLFRCYIGLPEKDSLDLGWPIKDFFDRVYLLGLRVVIGLDAALYAQPSRVCAPQRPCEAPGLCYLQRFGCYDNIRIAWRRMLRSGLVQDGHYHPALQLVILAWQPDLAVPLHCRDIGQHCSWPEILRGPLSAWDAVLDAEAELGVEGSVNFTMTFNASDEVSSRALPKCFYLRHPEGCADNHELRNVWLAANDLLTDFYEPHNDLGESFANRWSHSISAAMTSESVKLHIQEFYSFISPVRQSVARVLSMHVA